MPTDKTQILKFLINHPGQPLSLKRYDCLDGLRGVPDALLCFTKDGWWDFRWLPLQSSHNRYIDFCEEIRDDDEKIRAEVLNFIDQFIIERDIAIQNEKKLQNEMVERIQNTINWANRI